MTFYIGKEDHMDSHCVNRYGHSDSMLLELKNIFKSNEKLTQ